MSRLLRLGAFHPVGVLLAVAGASALALCGLFDLRTARLRLEVDPSVDRLLTRDDEERRFYERIRHVFGDDETLLVALATDDLFTPARLRSVDRVSRRLEELPDVKRVLSLATVPLLRSGAEGVVLESLADVAKPADADRLRRELRRSSLHRGVLVSEDERVAAFLVVLDVGDREFLARDYPSRIETIGKEEAPGAAIWVSGPLVVKAATTRALLRSLALVLPTTLALGAVVLWIAFRSAAGVLLPLATIALALLWTLGTLAWLGRPLNLVTAIAPPLVVTLGLAYAMHVVAEWARTSADPSSRLAEADRVVRAMQRVSLPALVAALTTAAGLAALALSPLAAIRDFGLAALLGLGYVTLLCFSLIPAGLRLFAGSRGARPARAAGFLEAFSERLADFSMAHRRAIVWIGVVVLVLGLWSASRVRVGASYVSDFPREAPVRRHMEEIGRAFGGANLFYVTLESDRPDAFAEPERLVQIQALQEWLEQQPEIGRTTSLVDHLALAHRALRGDPSAEAIPESRTLIKQLLVFGAGEAIEGSVDLEFRMANIVVRTDLDSSEALESLLTRIEARLGQLPPPLEARVTGGSVLLARAMERIARGQLASLAAAFLAIYAILAALFTSFRMGLLALLPNAVPVALFFGALGLGDVPLNPSTSLVACIALGLAVDDTVHYLVRFQREARRRASEQEATRSALRALLRPITFTTLVLCLGFLTLTLSELRNQVQFGALAAFTLAAAWIGDVTLTPALCAGVRIVTFWDVLRVDLGPKPQSAIPLLRGLSTRQARTVAAILDFRELAAGEPLVRQGEPLTDVFVVIEGELEIWTERDAERVHLYRATRGDVVGEVGFFAAVSPSNVVAACPARLLRFEDSDLEYLVKRHPRIAAHVYRNLNLAQADLMVAATRRIR